MKQNENWYQLDNAAKMIPSTAKGGNTRVFRITCELTETVDGEILQKALDRVIIDFPYFNSVLRKGLFWYYLDVKKIHAEVTKDNLNACSAIYFAGKKNLLYRVSYYRKRINLEMFHVLADGTGGFEFLKSIVSCYISLKHGLPFNEEKSSSSSFEKSDDAFRHFYSQQKGLKQLKSMSAVKAYHIKGTWDENLMPHLIEGTVSASAMRELAHRYNTSIGIFVTSLYIAAVIDEMSVNDRKKPIVISVPVNLRKYFPSKTTRNFFGVINIRYRATDFDGDLKSIVSHVSEEFKTQLSPDKILETMNSYSYLENNLAIKMVPLLIKDIVIWHFANMSRRGITSTMSNLGNIEMPEEYESYIEKFCPFMTADSEQICVATYHDKMVFGEVTAYSSHEVMLHFFRRLVDIGIPVELASNDYDEDKS